MNTNKHLTDLFGIFSAKDNNSNHLNIAREKNNYAKQTIRFLRYTVDSLLLRDSETSWVKVDKE